MRRGHRKIGHNESIIDIPESQTRRIEIKKTNNIFEPKKSSPTELTFEVDSRIAPDSTISLSSLSTTDPDATITLVSEDSPAAKGWTTKVNTQDEVVRIISEIFPDYPDKYIIGRGLQARGYHVRQDGSLILVDGKQINDVSIDDVDFFVFGSDTEDTVSSKLQEFGELRSKLDGPFPYSKTGHIRTFIVGILGDSGQLYGVRVQYVNLKNPKDRIHRVKNNAIGKQIMQEWNYARKDPRYQRKNLNRLKFTINDVYEADA